MLNNLHYFSNKSIDNCENYIYIYTVRIIKEFQMYILLGFLGFIVGMLCCAVGGR